MGARDNPANCSQPFESSAEASTASSICNGVSPRALSHGENWDLVNKTKHLILEVSGTGISRSEQGF